jgi:GR25 family glycosyltransferase involved in LPS biosynthesis
MDKDIDRLERVKKECEIVNIEFERFPGIKLSDLSKNIMDKYVPHETQLYGANGMIGCGLSHLFVWKDAIKKNYKNILVLEDDVYFTDDFSSYLNKVMSELPADYDILFLGCKDSVCVPPDNKKFNYIYKPHFPLLLHAMIISNKGLKKLEKLITKIDDHVDWLIARKISELNIYASKKKIANQTWRNSNNSNLKKFPKIINYYLDQIYDCHNIPQSYEYNFQKYKYKNYIITRMTDIIFNLGILSNIHYSILLLCLLYFFCDYDKFYLIIFLLGYLIGNILKILLNSLKINSTIIFIIFLLFILYIQKNDILFKLIKFIL